MNPGTWPRVAVVGAGAVGGYFGGLLARAGAPVIMVGRESFVAAVQAKGLYLDTLDFKEFVAVEAFTDLRSVQGADVVLLCVKTTDTAAIAREIARYLNPEAILLSLQNGVDSVDQIRAAASIAAYQVVVYVAASVPQPGHIKHVGRGDLVIGPETDRMRSLAAILARAGIPCRLSDNIRGELWAKLIWNCALNAISALGRAKYGRIAGNERARTLMRTVIEEVLAVARAERVILPGLESTDQAMEGAMKIATQMAEALSSTAQDLNRGRITEIDSLNGFVARRGLTLGVPTPVNQALYALVKLLEEAV